MPTPRPPMLGGSTAGLFGHCEGREEAMMTIGWPQLFLFAVFVAVVLYLTRNKTKTV